MKKITLITLILVVMIKINGFNFVLKDNLSSKYNPYDHIMVSYGLTITGTKFMNTIGKRLHIKPLQNKFIDMLIASSFVYTLGYIKEKYIDYSYQQTDINSNIVGISSALITINLYDLFKFNNKKNFKRREK